MEEKQAYQYKNVYISCMRGQSNSPHSKWFDTGEPCDFLCQSSIGLSSAQSKTRQGQLAARLKAQICFTLFLIKMNAGMTPAGGNQKFTKATNIILSLNKEGGRDRHTIKHVYVQ